MQTNMKKNNIIKLGLVFGLMSIFCSCGEDFLKPVVLDRMTPSSYFTNAAGLEAILGQCDSYANSLSCGGQFSDMQWSDVCIPSGPSDRDKNIIPDKMGGWFGGAYYAIGIANIIISRIDFLDIEYASDAEKYALLGRAYFHRAFWYYILTNIYGDIPFLIEETTGGKVDYQSTSRMSILKYIKEDMEFAYKWVPENAQQGKPGKGACGLLLAKICLACGDFDRAIFVADEVLSAHPLVQAPFAGGANLYFDLFSADGPINPANKEALYVTINGNPQSVLGSSYSNRQSNFAPNFELIKTPAQSNGFTYFASSGIESQYDYNATVGCGGGGNHPTNYYQYEIWTPGDMRGVYDRTSWRGPQDFCYNDPQIKGTEYYGTPLQKIYSVGTDTLAGWFQWPYYKAYIKNENCWVGGKCIGEDTGGAANQTILRSAEAALVAAEAYYWKGDNASAAEELNKLRSRAGAEELTTINGIADILDERARELYGEELRRVELVRISNLYAETGKACEATGKTYKYPISGNCKEGDNVKTKGVNFWFDWVTEKAPYWNDGKKYNNTNVKYTLSAHHVYLPINTDEIRLNVNGILNQNLGYSECEKNIEPLEAVRDTKY